MKAMLLTKTGPVGAEDVPLLCRPVAPGFAPYGASKVCRRSPWGLFRRFSKFNKYFKINILKSSPDRRYEGVPCHRARK